MAKKVAVYCRVSTEEQKKEGMSLDAQSLRLKKYLDDKGWELYKEFLDAGISGKSIKGRKAFQEMLQDARKNKFDILLITKFDRAFRNVIDSLNVLEEFGRLGIDFISVSENIDTTTAMGKAMFTLISVFAQLERELTAERVNATIRYRFEIGLPLTRCPVGYKWSKTKKEMAIDEKRAGMVKDLFDMTILGKGYKEICDKWKIAPQSYYNIVRNKIYYGVIEFEGQEKIGKHESLINKETFDKANETIKKRQLS